MADLRLEKAEFIVSAPRVDLLPTGKLPEIAFFGRSNVGKSSLLNFLTGRNQLARVSKTPGRTRLLNLFEAELNQKKIWLLDLPGHGYAKVSLQERKQLSEMLRDYFEHRSQLQGIIHLLDCRREPTFEDIDLSHEFRNQAKHYWVVLTKADQIPVSKRKDRQKAFAKILEIDLKSCLMVSVNEMDSRTKLIETLSLTV